jgi:preprotein translocase subunit SecG
MQLLQTLVLILFFLCCGILIFLVMIQSGKGGSVGIFGGGGSGTPFGASTMDVVTKATWWATGLFFLLAILAAISFADSGPTIGDRVNTVPETEDLGPSAAPGAPGTAPATESRETGAPTTPATDSN